MEKQTIILLITFFIVSLFSVFFLHSISGRFSSFPRYSALVIRVIDGDTFITDEGEQVRLLGINAPEKGDYFYDDAKKALKNLIENKTVQLEIDVTNQDKYGRSLRYVFIGKTFVNLWLIEHGLAHTYTDSRNIRYKETLEKAQESAIRNITGIWKQSNFSSCVYISQFNYKKEEFITLESRCGPISFTGWYLGDESNNYYNFPRIETERITIHTGYGKDNLTNLFWNKNAVWNDDGDTVFLRDEKGLLVLVKSY